MQKIKNYLCSEKGMRFINVLFALSLLIRRSGIGLIAYLCWGVYLLYCIPVSYTHLDVYKRQALSFNSSKVMMIKIAAPERRLSLIHI